jgi:hypothetical protein
MENIVRISELPKFIEDTVLAVSSGLAAARAKGVLVDMPKEIQFTAIVVSDFQALEMNGGSVVESVETQGGTNKETVDGSEVQKSESQQSGTGSRSSQETTQQENAHNRASEDSYTYE